MNDQELLEMQERLDLFTRRYTAFDSFPEMVIGTLPDYAPTFVIDNKEKDFLAWAYDEAQRRRGDPRRAYRIVPGKKTVK